jgi:hypothetical protein
LPKRSPTATAKCLRLPCWRHSVQIRYTGRNRSSFSTHAQRAWATHPTLRPPSIQSGTNRESPCHDRRTTSKRSSAAKMRRSAGRNKSRCGRRNGRTRTCRRRRLGSSSPSASPAHSRAASGRPRALLCIETVDSRQKESGLLNTTSVGCAARQAPDGSSSLAPSPGDDAWTGR